MVSSDSLQLLPFRDIQGPGFNSMELLQLMGNKTACSVALNTSATLASGVCRHTQFQRLPDKSGQPVVTNLVLQTLYYKSNFCFVWAVSPCASSRLLTPVPSAQGDPFAPLVDCTRSALPMCAGL